jgi:hypothetical protein
MVARRAFSAIGVCSVRRQTARGQHLQPCCIDVFVCGGSLPAWRIDLLFAGKNKSGSMSRLEQ